MSSYIYLKDFENENQFNLLLDELEKSINVDDKNDVSGADSNYFPFIFDVLIENNIYKVQFLKHKKVLDKYTFKILYDFNPKMLNLKLLKKYRKLYTPHFEMSYFDGNYIHIYATNYLESIDFLLLTLTGFHHFNGLLDIDGLEYNEKYDEYTFDKNIFNKPKKYIINKIYNLV
jgi:hypothetical protein